jgi:hypothetical protein
MSSIVIQLAECCNVESLYIRRREFYRRICGIFRRVRSLSYFCMSRIMIDGRATIYAISDCFGVQSI